MAIDRLFRQRDEDIARAYDLIDARDGFCPECKCCNGLGAAHLIDFSRPGKMGRGKRHGIDLSVSARRGYHDDFFDACNLCGNDVHKNGGRIRRLAAWNVDPDAGKGCDLLSQNRSVRFAVEPAVGLLLLMECPDILHGPLHDF